MLPGRCSQVGAGVAVVLAGCSAAAQHRAVRRHRRVPAVGRAGELFPDRDPRHPVAAVLAVPGLVEAAAAVAGESVVGVSDVVARSATKVAGKHLQSENELGKESDEFLEAPLGLYHDAVQRWR